MHDSAEFMKSSNSLLNEIDQISNDTGYRKWEIQTRLCTVCISFFFFFFFYGVYFSFPTLFLRTLEFSWALQPIPGVQSVKRSEIINVAITSGLEKK